MVRRAARALVAVFVVAMAPLALALAASAGAFTDEVLAPIRFLSAEEGREAIVDESLEPYFSLLQPLEMHAKTGSPVPGDTIEKQRAECRRRYQEGVLEFTAGEKEALTAYVRGLEERLAGQYPLIVSTPWTFLKVSDSVEGGLPHTRGRCIVLPRSRLVLAVIRRHSWPGDAGLILHEKLHVLQRVSPRLFESLYTDVWGLVKADSIEACPWLVEHQVVNPDAVECCWVLPVEGADGKQRYLWPMVVLDPGADAPRMPDHLQLLAIEVELTDGGFRVLTAADGRPVARPLLQTQEFVSVFAPSMYCFHPHEAAADLLDVVAVMLPTLDAETQTQPSVQRVLEQTAPVRDWFLEHMKAEPPPTPQE